MIAGQMHHERHKRPPICSPSLSAWLPHSFSFLKDLQPARTLSARPQAMRSFPWSLLEIFRLQPSVFLRVSRTFPPRTFRSDLESLLWLAFPAPAPERTGR